MSNQQKAADKAVAGIKAILDTSTGARYNAVSLAYNKAKAASIIPDAEEAEAALRDAVSCSISIENTEEVIVEVEDHEDDNEEDEDESSNKPYFS